MSSFFFFQAEDGIRDFHVTGVQTCALPISREIWNQTGRWDDEVVDIWFKTHLKDGTEVGLAWSHEEPIVEMMKQYIKSYKDLPRSEERRVGKECRYRVSAYVSEKRKMTLGT